MTMTKNEFAHAVSKMMDDQPDGDARDRLEAYLAAALDETRGDYDEALRVARQLLAADNKGGDKS